MTKITQTLTLSELDPTGMITKSYSIPYETDDGNGMKTYRFLLKMGDFEYYVNHNGKILDKEPINKK